MKIIVAADKNRGIGHRGSLLVSIPLDQQRFRKETLGKVVVMGRKTLESLPQGRPLDGRVNVVLTSRPAYRCKNAVIAHSMEEALDLLKSYDSDDIYVIGGESIYRQFLPYADEVILTEIDYAYHADAFFPELGEEWTMTEKSDEQTYFDLVYYFCRYRRDRIG